MNEVQAGALVPWTAAIACCGDDRKTVAALQTASVTVGIRPEVDITKLPSDMRARVQTYNNMLVLPGLDPGVSVTMTLYENTQLYSKTAKRDLTHDYDTLKEWQVSAAVIDDLLDSDQANAIAAAHDAGWVVNETEENVLTVSHSDNGAFWPDRYGGAPWPQETARTLTLTIRHAKWRDRRVRRLVGIEVTSTSTWATPPR